MKFAFTEDQLKIQQMVKELGHHRPIEAHLQAGHDDSSRHRRREEGRDEEPRAEDQRTQALPGTCWYDCIHDVRREDGQEKPETLEKH